MHDFNDMMLMANSVSGQDKPNTALWLATQAGKMELHVSWLHSVPQNINNLPNTL